MFISNQLVLSFLPYDNTIMAVIVMAAGQHHPPDSAISIQYQLQHISKVTFPGPFVSLSSL